MSDDRRKRKRHEDAAQPSQKAQKTATSNNDITRNVRSQGNNPWNIQIFVGTYEKTLHGIQATFPLEDSGSVQVPSKLIPSANGKVLKQHTTNENGHTTDDPQETTPEHRGPRQPGSSVVFKDTFLFTAHTSALRCLALSPPSRSSSGSQKVYLASGSSDERVNLYQVSYSTTTSPITPHDDTPQSPVSKTTNKELGSLLHHASPITNLTFPTHSKLLSSALDSTIAITRTRDWSLLSSIRAPLPPAKGRPSGDTAPQDGHPTGVNDFGVHPSLKLMIGVSKGEKCMRLWNLITGKRAGVLNFSREVLSSVGIEGVGKGHETGEGRRVVWDTKGEEFAVGFDKGAVVYGVNCEPQVRIVVEDPRTTRKVKLHQIRYFTMKADTEQYLAVSTEDGRVVFFATRKQKQEAGDKSNGFSSNPMSESIPSASAKGELGGVAVGCLSRIKDFKIVSQQIVVGKENRTEHVLVSGSSDGSIRLWRLDLSRFSERPGSERQQVGDLLGIYQTSGRITCLEAMIMSNSGLSEVTNGEEKDDARTFKGA